ncbi:hypothetical protein CcaverHIS631_0108670 [Cutaneotrichosporon cavernicola]|nr:hypothetical protein CcaverHIS631_0108670 [Cutaneotrichosporon cavernicola]BEJ03693.1 hypothetical protein CcaverHIS641_0108680 [Cutaneotrichosporon cavernicola]
MVEKDTDLASNGVNAHGRAEPTPPISSSPPISRQPKHSTWLMSALKSRRTWKNWARSMIALFVATLLMVIRPTREALGSSAAFFGLIACTILPPILPLSILFFALITLGLGMLLALVQTTMQAVQAQAQAAGVDPRLAMQAAIFRGDFLDPRSSAIHGVFIFIGAYFLGWIKATKPTLTLLSIFATILLDMNCTFGPLFPYGYYTLATTLIKPAAAYMAVAVVCTVLFFPQSLNHLVLSGLVKKTYQPMLALLKLQEQILGANPTNHEEWAGLADEAHNLSRDYIAAFGELEGQAKMLQLELSRGRISAGQLKEVMNRTKGLIATCLGLGTVVSFIDERDRALQRQKEDPLPYTTSRSKAAYGYLVKAEEGAGSNFEDLLPDLKAETEGLRSAAETAFAGGIEFLDAINNSRWKKLPKSLVGPEVRQANLIRLRATLKEFKQSGNNRVLERLRDRFDSKTGRLLEREGKIGRGSPRGLFRCFQFTASLTNFCSALIDWLELVEVIELGTPKNKLQFPGKFVQDMVRSVNDPSTAGDVSGLADRDDMGVQDDDDDDTLDGNEDKGADLKSRFHPRDPDAGPPGNAFQKVGRVVSTAMRAATGNNGIFALKYGLVSVALWVPAVCKSSAKFYYVNRGLWALIMAQTGLGVSTGEQVFNFVQRMSGTLAGVVMGMVLWYTGAQRGLGKAHGVTAAFVVGMGPFLFLRIAAPQQSTGFFVMMAVTIAFVVGYSWIDNHTVQLVHPGVGYTLAGKRALLVIIGFAASFVMILIPRPTSAKTLLRQGMAKNIAALGGMYSVELTSLEAGRNAAGDPVARRANHRLHFLRIFTRLQALHERFGYAEFELALRGPWPKEQYQRLFFIQGSMLSSSALLFAAYSQLEPEWCARITDRNALMHPAFVADLVSLFTILGHSLRQATPLPPIIPIFERLAYHKTYQHALRRAAAAVSRGPGQGKSDDAADTDTTDDNILLAPEAAALQSLESELTWDNAHQEQFALYATTLVALAHFIGGLNSLHATVLSLVGEHEIEGFAQAQERWARAEMAV